MKFKGHHQGPALPGESSHQDLVFPIFGKGPIHQEGGEVGTWGNARPQEAEDEP